MALSIEEQLNGLTGREKQLDENVVHTGKLIVLMEKPIHISIGPNYLEFCLGFFMLLFVIVCILFGAHANMADGFHKTIGQALGIITPISYLLTALSNPGLYDPVQNVDAKTKYCHSCMHFKPNNVIHCSKCNTCIEGFDHHCPFISKCVGKGNLCFFYVFVFGTSLFSLYAWYTLYLIIMGSL